MCNKHKFGLLILLLASFGMPAQAFQDELLGKLESAGKYETYQWLVSIEATHRDDAAYYDWRSRFAMELRDYRGAIDALTRLLELQPSHMGARLDLVLALQLDGRSFEARERLIELNRELESMDEYPATVRDQMTELNKLLLDKSARPDFELSGRVEVASGYDSNANRGAEDKTISVTLPGGLPLELALDPSSLKRSDEFNQLQGHVEYGQKSPNCHLYGCALWLAGASTRQYGQLDEFDQRYIYGGYQHKFSGQYQSEVNALVSNVISSDLEFNRVDEQNSVSLGYRQLLPGLRNISSGIRFEAIDEVDSELPTSYLSEMEVSGVLVWPRSKTFRQLNRRALWDIKASYHQRPDYRPGDTHRLKMSVGYPFALGYDVTGALQASYQYRQDAEEFSPIFFADTRRQDHEFMFNAFVQYPFSDAWRISSSAVYEQTRSSIPLFDVTRFQLRLNLGYVF